MSRTPSLKPGVQALAHARESDLDVGQLTHRTHREARLCLPHWAQDHAWGPARPSGVQSLRWDTEGGLGASTRQPASRRAAGPWKTAQSLMEGWPRRQRRKYAYGPPGPVLGTKCLRRPRRLTILSMVC